MGYPQKSETQVISIDNYKNKDLAVVYREGRSGTQRQVLLSDILSSPMYLNTNKCNVSVCKGLKDQLSAGPLSMCVCVFC